MRHGQKRSFERAVLGGLSLLAASLIESFAAVGTAKVLVSSGRLLRMPERRLFETGRFTFDIAASGGAPPGSEAHDNVVEIRLLHAFIRKKLRARGGFDEATFGLPINQEDYASTLLMFSHVYVRGLQLLGVTFDQSEQQGVHHNWRWIGHVMGVDSALLTTSADEERLLYAAVSRRQFLPDDNSRTLAHDLLSAMAGKPPFYLPLPALYAVSRRLVGETLAEGLRLPDSPSWARWVERFARMAGLGDRVERRMPLGRLFSRQVGRIAAERMLKNGPQADASSWVRS
jgi:hypothetical protein